ncbi:hypothetical protein OUHCRE13_14950 [Enterobacter roggenkampii]|nr:hypothetical protein KAM339_007750 [Aeromonas caviae]
MRQVEWEVRTQERLGCRHGPVTAEYQNACLDRAHSGPGYAIAPRPARQFNSNIDFNLRRFTTFPWLANADKAPVPLKLMQCVRDGARHDAPCGMGARAEVITAAAFDPASFFEGGCTP